VEYEQQVVASLQGEAEELERCLHQLREQTRGELDISPRTTLE
jgi:hypothetical protein